MSAVPKLRFPEFNGEWSILTLGEVVDDKRRITYGIVQPGEFVDEGVPLVRGGDYARGWVDLSSIKRVTEEIDRPYKRSKLRTDDLLLTIVGANTGTVARVPNWLEGANITQTTARVSVDSSKARSGFIEQYLKSSFGAAQVYKFIKGAAQPGLNLSDVEKFILFTPRQKLEQQKIASFLLSIDKKIDLLRQKKDGLELYKKGLMQKIFSQEIRFKQDDGSDFPDWKEVALGDVLHEHKEKSAGQEPVFSVSVSKGLVNQIEHLGRSFSAADTGHYNKAKPHDVIYTKSPTGNFPLGIIKQSTIDFDVIVSPLYGVFTPETGALGFILNVYFESEINVGNYLSPLVQKGAKNTIACTNKRFLEGRLRLPRSNREQRKIADVLVIIQKKIAVTASQIEQMETFKKGLLQQMFV